MQLSEARATELRDWVIKRLENISDADPDVLAEYVLALLRSDAPDDAVQKSAIENLEDFLKEHTLKFVNELFSTFAPKADATVTATKVEPSPNTLPGLNIATNSFADAAPIEAYDPTTPLDLSSKTLNGIRKSRKRSHNDRFNAAIEQDPHYAAGDRKLKAPRGLRGGRDDRNGGYSSYGVSTDPRQRNSGQTSSFSGMPAPPTPPPGFPPFNPNDPVGSMLAMQAMFPQVSAKKSLNSPLPPKINQRCKDYDVKGYCVLGSQCPYDHGNDPVVAPGKSEEYDPEIALSHSNQPMNGYKRRGNMGRGRGSERRNRGGSDQSQIHSPRDSRAAFSDPKPSYDKSNTTIVIEQIPEENFEEEAVRDFFSQYGAIKEVTMRPYKRLAIVQYNDYGAARRAYDSPKVIFDNRFVKVYWYRASEDNKPNGTPSRKTSTVARSSSSQQSPVTPSEPLDQATLLAQQAEAQKNFEAKAKARREMIEARADLARKQEEMAKKHDSERAELLAKIAAKESGTPPNKGNEEFSTSKAAATNGDKKAAQDEKVNRALREQLAKLEAEAKSLGIDPDAPSEDSYPYSPSPYGVGYRGRGSGRGRFATRGRGTFRGGSRGGSWAASRGGSSVKRLDNRPKRVAVSGVEWTPEKDECLREHLVGIVQFESLDPHPSRPDSLIVSFKERYMAEMFMHAKSEIPGIGKVEFSWVAGPASLSSSPTSPPMANGAHAHAHAHARNRSDGEVSMGNNGDFSEDGQLDGNDANMHDGDVADGGEGEGGKELGGQSHDVEYDVAEENDWGIE